MRIQRRCVVTVISASLLLMMSGLAKAEDAAAASTPPAIPPAAPANPDVVKDWNGSLSLGASLANGNSSAFQINSSAALDKLWKNDEWHFGANGAYGVNNYGSTNNQETTANNIHGLVSYRHLFNERLYGLLGEEITHDDVADITYRFTTSPALGYYFIKSPASMLRGEAGPSWIYERDHGAGAGTQNYIALRFAERGEHAFGKSAKVWEEVEYLPRPDDFGSYLLNSEAGIEASMTKTFGLRFVARDQYNSRPVQGRKTNDLVLLAALSYKFGAQ
jgi:putative salt-induced outer membrane protein YdiY